MPNQSHLEVFELEIEKQRWAIVRGILEDFCKKNHIGFDLRFEEKFSELGQDKILTAYLFDVLPYNKFLTFAEQCKKLNKKGYVITDSWIDVDKFQHDHAVVYSLPKLLSFTAIPNSIRKIQSRAKLYNLFIHRVDSVRQSWLYLVYLQGLLDLGYVSFNLYQLDTEATGSALFKKIHDSHLNTVDAFDLAYHQLKHLVPIRNFPDNSDLSEFILDSKYSLVLDTYANFDNCGSYYVSEKVTRALQYPNVNLLFLQKGTLGKLSQSGFHIEPTMLEIDQFDWVERQQKILHIVKEDTVTITEQELYDQARHNRSILNAWLEQCSHKNFFSEIFEKILSD